MKITKTSPLTGKINTMDLDVTQAQMDQFADGAFVQVAFSNLNADEREFILTGITKEEWDATFPEEEDE